MLPTEAAEEPSIIVSVLERQLFGDRQAANLCNDALVADLSQIFSPIMAKWTCTAAQLAHAVLEDTCRMGLTMLTMVF